MFLIRWILPFGLRREQPKTRRREETAKPQLEELKERILPSATPSPKTGEAAMQMVTTMMEQQTQRIVTSAHAEIWSRYCIVVSALC